MCLHHGSEDKMQEILDEFSTPEKINIVAHLHTDTEMKNLTDPRLIWLNQDDAERRLVSTAFPIAGITCSDRCTSLVSESSQSVVLSAGFSKLRINTLR
jgi:hypothetical protein